MVKVEFGSPFPGAEGRNPGAVSAGLAEAVSSVSLRWLHLQSPMLPGSQSEPCWPEEVTDWG